MPFDIPFRNYTFFLNDSIIFEHIDVNDPQKKKKKKKTIFENKIMVMTSNQVPRQNFFASPDVIIRIIF